VIISIPFFIVFGLRFIPFVGIICVLIGEISLGNELNKMQLFAKHYVDTKPDILDNSIYGNYVQKRYLIATSERDMFLFAPGWFIPQIKHLLPEFKLDYAAAVGYIQRILITNLILSLIVFNPFALALTLLLFFYSLLFSKNSYSFFSTDFLEQRLIKLFIEKNKPYLWTNIKVYCEDEGFKEYYLELFNLISVKLVHLQIYGRKFKAKNHDDVTNEKNKEKAIGLPI